MRKGRFSIHGLIVLTINDLEVLERSIENFSLIELLRAYSQCVARPDLRRAQLPFRIRVRKKLLASATLAESPWRRFLTPRRSWGCRGPLRRQPNERHVEQRQARPNGATSRTQSKKPPRSVAPSGAYAILARQHLLSGRKKGYQAFKA